MTGTFPVGTVHHLKYLQEIRFSMGTLRGRIPSELVRLQSVDLQANQLTGTIPDELYGPQGALQILELTSNRLNGTLSSLVGNLQALRVLNLADNGLTGPIPTELGRLPTLTRLNLYHNKFTGPIPTELGGNPELAILRLDYNLLSGTLPSVTFASLEDFEVRGNSGLSGGLPAALLQSRDLYFLDLQDCNFTGPISSDLIGSFLGKNMLSHWILGNNRFTGTLPGELNQIPGLLQLDVSGNNFTGPMPLCDSTQLPPNELVADCQEVSCECCTSCCTDGKGCVPMLYE
jgi:Leucine-rich repeat (LRR) protein